MEDFGTKIEDSGRGMEDLGREMVGLSREMCIIFTVISKYNSQFNSTFKSMLIWSSLWPSPLLLSHRLPSANHPSYISTHLSRAASPRTFSVSYDSVPGQVDVNRVSLRLFAAHHIWHFGIRLLRIFCVLLLRLHCRLPSRSNLHLGLINKCFCGDFFLRDHCRLNLRSALHLGLYNKIGCEFF